MRCPRGERTLASSLRALLLEAAGCLKGERKENKVRLNEITMQFDGEHRVFTSFC